MYAYRHYNAVNYKAGNRDTEGRYKTLHQAQESQLDSQYRTRRPYQAHYTWQARKRTWNSLDAELLVRS